MLIQFFIGRNLEVYGESDVLGADYIKLAPGSQTDNNNNNNNNN